MQTLARHRVQTVLLAMQTWMGIQVPRVINVQLGMPAAMEKHLAPHVHLVQRMRTLIHLQPAHSALQEYTHQQQQRLVLNA